MNFSPGQKIFALLFFLVFVAFALWSYRKDMRMQKVHYSGVLRILAIIIFMFLLVYGMIKILFYLRK